MEATLEAVLPPELRKLNVNSDRSSIPLIAKDPIRTSQIRQSLALIETSHRVILGDARAVDLDSSSVHLVVTSPPYWTLKEYPNTKGQMGRLVDYDEFLKNLNRVWERCFESLVPGGRLICVVGDVCLSRKQNSGRHSVVPLHAAIQMQCTKMGFDNLSPIIWHKISNLKTETEGGSSYLGKPFEPNGIIKNDIEYILMLRKPGGYRQPSNPARLLSVISRDEHEAWFRQIWNDIPGESTKHHPAPFPVDLAERLVRMFSFVGDTIFDPFTGTASAQVAAKIAARNSIGVEIDPEYHAFAQIRLDSIARLAL